MAMLAVEGIHIGRFKVGRLMEEANLVSKQQGSHKYKVALDERLEIPNTLERRFDVGSAIRCGDITYIWAGGRWVYLAVIVDLYAKLVVYVHVSPTSNRPAVWVTPVPPLSTSPVNGSTVPSGCVSVTTGLLNVTVPVFTNTTS